MSDFRASLRDLLAALAQADSADRLALLRDRLSPDAAFDVAAPVNRLTGPDEIAAGLYDPLSAAFGMLTRRDEIYIGSRNARHENALWCASVTHYVGTFRAPFLGIPPSGKLVFLRSGEFYRLDDTGRIAEAKILLDLVDLMRQAGRMPLPQMLGTEMLFPAPATHDGILPATGDGAASLALVEAMLGDLHNYDPVTGASYKQTGAGGYWADDMLWYGPGGIGSTYAWDGFVSDHRAAFLTAFPDRKGGNHYCRIGDGTYAAVSGWPSMTMTHAGAYLGVPATGKPLTLRVMDFYRCAEGKIAENWVCLDYVDLFGQMGVELIGQSTGA